MCVCSIVFRAISLSLIYSVLWLAQQARQQRMDRPFAAKWRWATPFLGLKGKSKMDFMVSCSR